MAPWKGIDVVVEGLVRYAQSALGVGWAIIHPVFSMLVFTVVFCQLAKIDFDGRETVDALKDLVAQAAGLIEQHQPRQPVAESVPDSLSPYPTPPPSAHSMLHSRLPRIVFFNRSFGANAGGSRSALGAVAPMAPMALTRVAKCRGNFGEKPSLIGRFSPRIHLSAVNNA